MVAACARCGVFLCSLETRPLDDATSCDVCVVRPDVDPLASYRARFWGRRRDPWSWIFGISGVSLFFGSLSFAKGVRRDDAPLIAIGVGLGALQLAWFSRMRWARYALPATVSVLAAIWLVRVGPNFLASLPFALLAWASMASAFWSVPSRLFFELELPRRTLWNDFGQYRNNWLSVFSVLLALGGIAAWPLAAVGLVSGAIALWRTRLPFTPPIRGKWVSIVGVVLAANVLLTHAATRLE